MNRVRMILFAGVLGAFGFGTTPAQVTVPTIGEVVQAPSQ